MDRSACRSGAQAGSGRGFPEAPRGHREPPTDFHARFALGLRLPGVHWDSEGWLATTDSWAYVRDGAVHQWGPRDLFTELERACRWWRESGSPELYDFGLTVTAGGQTAWLGTPGSGRSWDL
ncbi:hypothetical protein [Streptomyces sp. NPDC005336]|uniref:hypothetical protein n=1 Tax=Streptomyces sp. NPDC005336 TaxID=3157035 RepID=UPI00339F10FB